jgi:hypothetical protein
MHRTFLLLGCPAAPLLAQRYDVLRLSPARLPLLPRFAAWLPRCSARDTMRCACLMLSCLAAPLLTQRYDGLRLSPA